MNTLEYLQSLLDEAEAGKQIPAIQLSERQLDPRLHGYQRRAVEHLRTNNRAALLMEMGLGKTATVLQALGPEHLPAVVIAPKRVAEVVWPTEAETWRHDLSVVVAAGGPAKRKTALDSAADVVVIGRDNIADVPLGKFRTVVLDELSGFKSKQSKRWAMANRICKKAAYVWGLTGTPSPNGQMDLWSQMALLDGGQRLESTLTKFRTRYFSIGRVHRQTGQVIQWDLRPGSAEAINRKISDICLTMRSEDYLELPQLILNDVKVPMNAKATRTYEAMRKKLVADLRGEGGGVHAAANFAVATGKLSQIAAGFLYPDEEGGETTHLNSDRVDAVCEIIEGTGSPVLVFYRFVEELARLQNALPQARTIKDAGVIQAWNRGEVPVLLAHPASAGHGLNLQQGGSTIVWSTLTWSPEEYEQANARLMRQGQTRPVTVHRLMGASVDYAIASRLEGKASVQDALMAALGD